MRTLHLFLLVFLWLGLGLHAQDTITVMQYNLLYYGNYNSAFAGCNESTNNTQDKDENIRTILNHVKPDILTVNEFGATQALLNSFIQHNLNINGANYWKSDDIINYAHSDIVNHIFYDSRKMELKRHAVIRTAVRDIDAYELYFKTAGLAVGDTVKLVCVVAHLKAGNSTTDEGKRRAMIQNAMDFIDENYPTDNVLIMGDFNMYSSSESAYRLLTQNYSNHDILFVDPLSFEGGVGNWHNTRQYAPFHTQATMDWSDNPCRTGGGLDDRFDMILMSDEILMGYNKLHYLSNSYKAVGNDGNHFNQSVNDGYNSSVPAEVADALYYSSDHLPVAMKMRVSTPFGVGEPTANLFQVYPNPTNGILNIKAQGITSVQPETIEYRITNLTGQTLVVGRLEDETTSINITGLPSGLYFISIGETTRKFVKSDSL